MYIPSWLHEMLFGALLANIAMVLAVLKWGIKIYNHLKLKDNQHKLMWIDYKNRHHLKVEIPGE